MDEPVNFEIYETLRPISEMLLRPEIKEALSLKMDERSAYLDYKMYGLYVIKLFHEGKPIGFGLAKEHTKFIVEVEIAIMQEFRGKTALKIVKHALTEFLKKHPYPCIMALIRKKNKKSLMFAHMIGLKLLGSGEKFYYLGATYKEIVGE